MKVVIKTVNLIKSKGLNHPQFEEFLKFWDSQYNDGTFYAEASYNPEFEDKVWVGDFAFLVYIVSHPNVVNNRLQRKDQLINDRKTVPFHRCQTFIFEDEKKKLEGKGMRGTKSGFGATFACHLEQNQSNPRLPANI